MKAALVLVLSLALATGIALSVARRESSPDSAVRVIRVAHYQLEAGVRESFTAIAADYSRLHPGVQIEQIAVPKKIFAAWMRTQFVGGTAPDLVQLGEGLSEEIVLGNFTPLTRWLRLPNPYNELSRGNDASEPRISWRDSFRDGVASYPSYLPALIDYYGVPNAVFTLRVFYNYDELERLTGSRSPPATFDELLALCDLAKGVHGGNGALLIGGEDTRLLIDTLVDSQMHRLIGELDDLRILHAGLSDYFALKYLSGKWSFSSPGLVSGHELARTLGLRLQPGFLQAGAEDALMVFLQGKSLGLITTTQAYGSLKELARFPFTASVLPLPLPGHARFGIGTMGANADPIRSEFVLGLTQTSRDPDLAVDFLRFLTSQSNSIKFAEQAGWFPATGSATPASLPPELAPITQGFPEGIRLVRVGFGVDSRRVYYSALPILFEPHGSVGDFVRVVTNSYRNAVKDDLGRARLAHRLLNMRNDSQFAAAWRLSELGVSSARDRATLMVETQANRETRLYRTTSELNRSDQHPR